MNWLTLIAAFAIAVPVGAFLARLLERGRPGWSRRRRLWAAAGALPAFILVATLAGEARVLGAGGESGGMRDLALFAIAIFGIVLAAAALAGGLVGASFALGQEPE